MAGPKEKYNIARDHVLSQPLVLWVDTETGKKVVGPNAENATGMAVCIRRMEKEDGTPGDPRLSTHSVYQAKRTVKRIAWVIQAKGIPQLQTVEEGALVLGSALKRLPLKQAATVYPSFARYAELAAKRLG